MELYRSDKRFYGRHADRAVELVDIGKYFPSFYELLCVAPFYGLMKERKATPDRKGGSGVARRIPYGDVLVRHEQELATVFRLVMLCHPDMDKFPMEERINVLFRLQKSDKDVPDSANTEKEEAARVDSAYLQEFDQYVLGGIDALYEDIEEGATDDEVKLARLIDVVEGVDSFRSVTCNSILDKCHKLRSKRKS